jgi:hypothetical protein
LVDFGNERLAMIDHGCPSSWLIEVDHDHGWLRLTMTMVDYGWSEFIMVGHAHGWPLLTMWIWLLLAIFIMFNRSLIWKYCIAMMILFWSAHYDTEFSSSHCDIKLCSSHDIIRLWSSNCDEGFFLVTLWNWNRVVTIRKWVMFVTLWC